jgi:hypothetical protein
MPPEQTEENQENRRSLDEIRTEHLPNTTPELPLRFAFRSSFLIQFSVVQSLIVVKYLVCVFCLLCVVWSHIATQLARDRQPISVHDVPICPYAL